MKIVKFSRSIAAFALVILICPVISLSGDQVPYKDRVEAVVIGAIPVSPNEVLLPFMVTRGQGSHVGRFTTLGELLVNTDTFQFTGNKHADSRQWRSDIYRDHRRADSDS